VNWLKGIGLAILAVAVAVAGVILAPFLLLGLCIAGLFLIAKFIAFLNKVEKAVDKEIKDAK
jgi:hypothetical protein